MKNIIDISGRLLFPLEIGDCAVVQHGGDWLRTSRVVEIFEESPEFVHFETMNSIYKVYLTAFPIRAALPSDLAMCA